MGGFHVLKNVVRETALGGLFWGLFFLSGMHHPPPPLHYISSRQRSGVSLPKEGHGCGPRPMPGPLPPTRGPRPRGGPDTGQLWGVAHRNRPWAQGHTTTDPQDTPGRHLPGAPERKLIQQRWDAASQYPDTSTQTSEDQPNNDATHIRVYQSRQKTTPSSSLPALHGRYTVNMQHKGECESQSACMAQRCYSQSACMAHRCESQSACMVHRCESHSACMTHGCQSQRLHGAHMRGTKRLHGAQMRVTKCLHGTPMQVTESLHGARVRVTERPHGARMRVTGACMAHTCESQTPTWHTDASHRAPAWRTEASHRAPTWHTDASHRAPCMAHICG